MFLEIKSDEALHCSEKIEALCAKPLVVVIHSKHLQTDLVQIFYF
jgi:hypothetical protein